MGRRKKDIKIDNNKTEGEKNTVIYGRLGGESERNKNEERRKKGREEREG